MGFESIKNLIFLIAVFGLIFSFWTICVLLWRLRSASKLRTVQKRLGIIAPDDIDESSVFRLWQEAQKEAVALTELPPKLTLRERLERLRNEAGWQTPIPVIVLGVIGVSTLLFALTFILTNEILLSAAISVISVALFWAYMRKCITKRTELFERQLVDALGVAARSLRAGHPLVSAFQLISEEIDEPVGGTFARICQKQALGSNLKDAIYDVAKTATSQDSLKLFATAVAIQLQSGGNLADLMDSLAFVIRARMRLKRRVRILTAQTQFSKYVLIGLPIFLFLLLNIMNPKYMDPFYSTQIGRFLLAIMIISVLVGIWVMNRISILRY